MSEENSTNYKIELIESVLQSYEGRFSKNDFTLFKMIYWHPLMALVQHINSIKSTGVVNFETYKSSLLTYFFRLEKKIVLCKGFANPNYLFGVLINKLKSNCEYILKTKDISNIDLCIELLNCGYRCVPISDFSKSADLLRSKLKKISVVHSSLSMPNPFFEVFLLAVAKLEGKDVYLYQHGAMYETDFNHGPDYFLPRIYTKYFTYFNSNSWIQPKRYMKGIPSKSFSLDGTHRLKLGFVIPNYSLHTIFSPCVSGTRSHLHFSHVERLAIKYNGTLRMPRCNLHNLKSGISFPGDWNSFVNNNSVIVCFDLSSMFYELLYLRKPFVVVLDSTWKLKPQFLDNFGFMVDSGLICFDNNYDPPLDIILNNYRHQKIIMKLESARNKVFFNA